MPDASNAQPKAETCGLAIASFVLSLLPLFVIGPIISLILGLKARRRIAASGGRLVGDGLAFAGIVISVCILVITFLLIVVAVAAIVVPKFSGRTEQARVTAATSQIATFGTALDAFEVDTGAYPKGKSGLDELVSAPREAVGWKGSSLKNEIPFDPWGNAYVYECPGKNNPTGYDIMSMGPDGRVGGDDDITSWQQGNTKR